MSLSLASALLVALNEPGPQPGAYLPNAHSHNDYEQKRPFSLAYEYGFASIEADVFLVEGELMVAHDRKDIQPDRTLKSLYLEPMRWAARRKKGWLYKPGQQMILMVDIKADGPEAWKTLRQQAIQYSDIIWPKGRGPVRIVVSGDRPRSLILEDRPNWTTMDGRMSDLDQVESGITMISENWRSHFTNLGLTPFKAEESQKLKAWTDKAHARGRLVRFWATPESETLWSTLLDHGVDLIGTDDPKRLASFLNAAKSVDSGWRSLRLPVPRGRIIPPLNTSR